MKLTKSQLKEIIREEIQKLSFNKSLRLKPFTENWVLSEDGETILNPETGRKIKVSSALSYPKDHPAYKAAMKTATVGGVDDTDSTKTVLQKPERIDAVYKSVRKNMNKLADSMDSNLKNMHNKFASKSHKNKIKNGALLASTVLGVGGGIAVAIGGAPAVTAMGQFAAQYSTILARALAPEAIGNALLSVKGFYASVHMGVQLGILGGQAGVRIPAWMHRIGKKGITKGISNISRKISNFADKKLKSRGITDSYNLMENIKIDNALKEKLINQVSTINPIEIEILEMMVSANILDKSGKITDYSKAEDIFKQLYNKKEIN